MSTLRTRRSTAFAACALVALLASPRAISSQEEAAQPVSLPVLYYSFGERSKDFRGDFVQTLKEFKELLAQKDDRIAVSAFHEPIGSEGGRIHWLQAVEDVFSIRYIVRSWQDARLVEIWETLEGLYAPGTYFETVLVPCPAEPVSAPPDLWLILVHRTARAKTVEYAAARRAAVELTDYLNANVEGLWVQLYENLLGDFGTLHWLIRVEDLATWHRVETGLLEDATYQDLFEQTFSRCVEGSLRTGWGIPMLGP